MDSHPTDDLLTAFALGKIDARSCRDVETHLAACPNCCTRLDQLRPEDVFAARFRTAASILEPNEARNPPADSGNLFGTETFPAETATDDDVAAGEQIGPYQLIRKLGEGGMGTVWEAEQSEPVRRRVAIKLVKSGMDSKPILARFEAERQALALMDHPNIARVLDAGTVPAVRVHDKSAETLSQPGAGRPYFVMELVNGFPIAKFCDDALLSVRERLELFIPVCHAIQHAHQKGIIHRDLKPSNVLVTLYDGKPVPKVIDFGLAKALHQPLTEKTIVSALGMILGTPEYMAPEQADVSAQDVDTRADIYSLGVILYVLLTGSPPFDRRKIAGGGLLELLRLIREEEPTWPSKKLASGGSSAETAALRQIDQKQLPRLLRGELDWIVMKCLRKERSRRYDNATSLAEDVGRYLRGEPIAARPTGRIERAVKWAKRRPALAGLTAVSLLAVAALVGGALYYNAKLFSKQQHLVRQEADLVQLERDLNTERGRVGAANVRVGELNELAQFNLARSNLILADSNWKTGDALGAIKALSAVPADSRLWEWRYQQRRALGSYRTLWGHTAPVSSVILSSDDAMLASASEDGTTKLWDATTGSLLRTLSGHTGAVTGIAFNVDGTRLASGSDDHTIKLWDCKNGALLQTLSESKSPIRAVAFSADGSRLASGDDDGLVRLWDAKTGVLNHTLSGHTGQVSSVAFSPDGTRLVSGGFDRTVKVWIVSTRQVVRTLEGHTAAVRCVAFSPDGAHLASGSEDRTVRIWNASNGGNVHSLAGQGETVRGLAFSPDGTRLASADDQAIKLWDVNTGTFVQALFGHTREVCGIGFSADGGRLVSGSVDNTVKLWDVKAAAGAFTFTGHTQQIRGIAFSPDGRQLVSASDDQTVRLWDRKTGILVRTFTGHTGPIRAVALSPDGIHLASGSEDKTVKVWNVSTGVVVHTFTEHTQEIRAVAFSPDGTRLATGGNDKTVKLWDLSTGVAVHTIEDETGEVRAIAFSPDGGRVAFAGEGHTITYWDTSAGKIVQTLTGHTAAVFALAFSRDGSRLVSGSFDSTIRLWDAKTGAVIHTLIGHTAPAFCVALSPDGLRIASGSEDKTVKLWDVRTGAVVQTLHGHGNVVAGVAFNPVDSRLASGSWDTTVRIWDPKLSADVLVITGHTKWVRGVAFSPDGAHLASGSYDNTAKLWDAQTGALVRTLTHDNWVTSVAFSPDSARLVTGSWDRTARLWDVKTGELVQTLTGHKSPILGVAFSPDGTCVATRDRTRDVKVWDVQSGNETDIAGAGEWLHKAVTTSRSPDGQWFAASHADGSILLSRPLPPDETELGYLKAMARPDANWHWAQAQRFEKEMAWFAVEFHCKQVLKVRPDDPAAKSLGKIKGIRSEGHKVKP